MIGEEKLKEAAAEVAQVLLESLPNEENTRYTFSRKFQKKMTKLLWKEKHPVIFYGVKSAACFLGMIVLSGALVLACSKDVRAAVFGWFKEAWSGNYIRYFYEGEGIKDSDKTKYETSWVPKGYTLIEKDSVLGDEIYIYLDAQGMLAQFTYCMSPEENNAKIYVDGNSPDYEYVKTKVLEYDAELYDSVDDNHTSTLIWSNKNDALFVISAMLEKEELIKWAESVVEIKE